MVGRYRLFRRGVLIAGGPDLLLAHDLAKEVSTDGRGPVAVEGPGILRGREVIAVYKQGNRILNRRSHRAAERTAIVEPPRRGTSAELWQEAATKALAAKAGAGG